MYSNFLIVLVLIQMVAAFIPRNGPCMPGELVWVDCNLCTCNQRGMPNHICANMWCQPQPKAKGMTTEMPLYEDEEEQEPKEEDNVVEAYETQGNALIDEDA